MERDRPVVIDIEFDNGETYSLREFYNDEDDVQFFENEQVICAFDYDDPMIMVQKKDTRETKMMNLLYARKEFPNLYERWFNKSKH